MMAPGKYDREATAARLSTGAMGVILIVLNGTRGSGFSAQLPPQVLPLLPSALRDLADQIEAEAKKASD